MPSWVKPGPILIKKKPRNSKYDPVVEKVELLQANPQYAFIKFPTGRECTVSLRDLAPCGESAESGHVDLPYTLNVDNVNTSLKSSETSTNNADIMKDNSLIFNQGRTDSISIPHEPLNSPENSATPTSSPNKQCNTPRVENQTAVRRSTRERKPPVKLDL